MREIDSGITLQKLEIFCCVAELGSVTRAAERIGIAQPVVTAHIRSLETKLGVRLVGRTGRNISLTEAGQRVFSWASEVVASKRQMEREIQSLVGGALANVSVAASITTGSYMLPDVVIAFHSSHPEATISTHVSNSRSASEAVRNGECDFGLMIPEDENASKDLIVEALWSEPLILVASPTTRIVGETVDIAGLAGLPFVTGPRSLTRRVAEDAKLLDLGVVRHNIVLELGHPESIKRAVRSDVGVSLLFETAVREELERGLLNRIAVPGLDLSIPIVLVYRRDKSFSRLQSAMIEKIRGLAPQNAAVKPSASRTASPKLAWTRTGGRSTAE
ncbi:LysR family transcriptional regulator [Microvirga antarctica]|uniref:LysR family transcriptional regulator n=1 Tax=Microvirga antarctica TaxID=2819233 RepID=UPI001B312D42|nr:LysR family transcriptional regulator [Microvirga antarctica]